MKNDKNDIDYFEHEPSIAISNKDYRVASMRLFQDTENENASIGINLDWNYSDNLSFVFDYHDSSAEKTGTELPNELGFVAPATATISSFNGGASGINTFSYNRTFTADDYTYGSLYSIDSRGAIKWFINLNQSLDINPSNLFYSNPVVFHQDKLIVSTDLYLYILNSNTGSTYSKIAITSLLQPIASGKNLFLVTKDNLLVCINLDTGEIMYSVDISQNIANFLDTKKKSVYIKSLVTVNDNLFLFLNNS